jgi:hypothetical protein
LATTAARAGPPRPAPFPIHHRWDRNFFLVYVALIWVGIIAGFVPEMINHVTSGAPAYPIIIHVHGALFVSWVVLLTTQVLLIRNRKLRLHKKLGLASVALIPLMVVVGVATGLTMHKLQLGTPQADSPFLSVQLLDMIGFAALATAAVSARKSPSAHKRLILLATLSIADAGFARWLGADLHFGDGPVFFWIELYLPTAVLILGIGAYDWVTRRRVHPAWVAGAAWIFTEQLTAAWLYFNPAWKVLTMAAVHAWPWA